MSLARINLLNIGLMLFALGVAMLVPFETFLISYAVLGPLHYLTEISWLRDRQCFTLNRRDWIPLLGLSIAISAASLLASIYQGDPDYARLALWAFSLMLFAFGIGFVFAVIKDPVLRGTAVVLLAVTTFLFHGTTTAFVLFGLYMPTIIHVFVFTAAFVLYGALKQRSGSAHASLVVFVACAAIALFLDPGALGYVASDYAKDAYLDFAPLHATLTQHAGLASTVPTAATTAGSVMHPFANLDQLYTEPAGIQVGRFIAFAYTYHYFNWFSKTSIIRWHDVSKVRFGIIAALWLGSLAFYAYDYRTGMRWLLFLSLLHVLLEFPLNHKTFVGIGSELLGRFKARPASGA
ncbi:MAG: hypothetical protein NXI31_19305 [bacterium]|nr:hypothetical protein [bacterium]